MAINNVINANSTTPLVVTDGGTGANTLTSHSLLLGNGTSAVSALGAATDGQIPIGSTGSAPVLATLTAGTNITITPGPGTITIDASGGGGGGITTLTADDTNTASGSTVTIAGDTTNIFTTANNASTFTISQGPNLVLPVTNSSLNQGTITVGGEVFMQFYGDAGSGVYNIFIGQNSGGPGVLDPAGGATTNVGIGDEALGSLTTGAGNTAIGHVCGTNINTGSLNQLFGYGCGEIGLTTGSHNTMIGQQPGIFLVSGNYNFIGGAYQSAINYTGAETSNIILGSPGTTGENNVIRIGDEGTGNAQQNTCFIAGIANATVTGSAVLVDTSTGQLGLATSSERFKQNIKDMGDKSSPLMQLRPVTFSYKGDVTNAMQYGLIAEETATIMPHIVTYDATGNPYTIRYHELPSILLNELQKLTVRVEELEAKLANKG